MDTKSLGFHILDGPVARRVFFRAVVLASAITIVSLLRVLSRVDLGALASINYKDCVTISNSNPPNVTLNPGSYLFQSRILNNFWGTFDSMNCKKDIILTVSVVKGLMGKHFVDWRAKSLCIGEASSMAVSVMELLGFSTVTGLHKPSLFSLKYKKILYKLDYQDSCFDFVFSRDLDKLQIPVSFVLEVERILKPGGIGALLITSASPLSSFLRSSTVIHVGSVNELNLVVFKKKSETQQHTSFFYGHALPADCPSLTFTKPLIKLMEPLVVERPPEYEKTMSYLPKFVDVSTRKRLVYIDIGVGEPLNSNVTDSFLQSFYPMDQKAFSVYFVHYNTSILLSHVKRPGITFVYHPGLDGKATTANFSSEEDDMEEFDFLAWFKETVQHADFVVLKMNAGKVELKFLSDVFESGAICFVDEMFLGCTDAADDEGCMNVYEGLRNNGVYVHQWWEM